MRLFYALTFTEAAIEQIEDYRSTVSSVINSDSLVEASNFHITLAFLGEVSA
ncbi:MAG TPA: RNA 2',3'-cyclic phosphodiesterase, partial [Vibrio sp.]|nr:RNA 2',3'-cyclic phosphodiesterase [Vibrio sp.]